MADSTASLYKRALGLSGILVLVIAIFGSTLGFLFAGTAGVLSALIGSLVAPAGMGDRRIVVMGTDHVSTNTDVMFTVQLRDGRTELTQVPRDTFIESDRYGVMKANALYSSGGPEMVKQELSKLLSARVDRYLVLNLNAVQRPRHTQGVEQECGLNAVVPAKNTTIEQHVVADER
jgi:anionic cell wall polymer biosynthesis LytR-Cps2A-Psr (LCP) family protein